MPWPTPTCASPLSALKQLGPEARDGAPSVANLLTTDPAMRKDTLETLEAMKLSGSTLSLVLPKLLALFGDEKQEPIRNKVAEVLASIGKPAIDPLCVLLRNPKPENRAGAAAALGAMGTWRRRRPTTCSWPFRRKRTRPRRTKESPPCGASTRWPRRSRNAARALTDANAGV